MHLNEVEQLHRWVVSRETKRYKLVDAVQDFELPEDCKIYTC